MKNANVLILDASALSNNFLKLNARFCGKVICVLKADAYGHGLKATAKILYSAGARRFAVANIDEAVSLRKAVALYDAKIFSLGYIPEKRLLDAAKYAVCVPILSEEYCDSLLRSGRRLDCYLLIDSGMNRLGVDHRDVAAIERVLLKVKSSGRLKLSGAATHFSDGENETATAIQSERFFKAVGGKVTDISLRASAAGYLAVDDFPRIGLSLFGYGALAKELGLIVPLTLRSRIIRIKRVEKGETVGYNAVYTAKRQTFVGTFPLGYADGIMRGYIGGNVFVNGKKRTIIAVCMDMTMIELTGDEKCGDEVVVFSKEGNLLSLTKRAGTIVYEGLTALRYRAERVMTKCATAARK